MQDPEPQEDGSPGQSVSYFNVLSSYIDVRSNRTYNTTLRAIIPLPDPSAQPDSAEHLNAYPLFTAGSTVMALYPDTSCFYRAEVIASPKDVQSGNRVSLEITSHLAVADEPRPRMLRLRNKRQCPSTS